MHCHALPGTIRYDTIEEINVDSKAEYRYYRSADAMKSHHAFHCIKECPYDKWAYTCGVKPRHDRVIGSDGCTWPYVLCTEVARSLLLIVKFILVYTLNKRNITSTWHDVVLNRRPVENMLIMFLCRNWWNWRSRVSECKRIYIIAYRTALIILSDRTMLECCVHLSPSSVVCNVMCCD